MLPPVPILLHGLRISIWLRVLSTADASYCCSIDAWTSGPVVIAPERAACSRPALARGAVVSSAVQNIFLQLETDYGQDRPGQAHPRRRAGAAHVLAALVFVYSFQSSSQVCRCLRVLRSRGAVRQRQVQQWLEDVAQGVRDILYRRKACSSPDGIDH